MNREISPTLTAITARSLADYQNMFALDEADLVAGPVLDCPGGASSFGAQVRSLGGHVLSVDPIYQFAADEIAGFVQDNLARAAHIFATSTLSIDWSYLLSPRAYVQSCQAAADRFLSLDPPRD
jgi:hypothetical protein